MNTALRKSLPFIMFAILGGAGVYTWKSRRASTADLIQPTVPAPAKESHAVPKHARLAFLTDVGEPWQLRIDLLRRELTNECGEREIRYLYDLLAKETPQGELPEHRYVIANEIMEQLLSHDPDGQRFSSNLLNLLQDSRQPLVLRDYAVQYLVAWLNPRSPQAGKSNPVRPDAAPSPEIAGQVLQSLVSATLDPELEQTTIPGTTLMMLVDLARFPGGIDCSQVITDLKPWLTHALEDGSTLSTPVRVSAVQAAGILAPAEFRPTIRKIAYSENGQSSLRLPSIAVLGQCGDGDDIAKLQQIASTHPELSYAAQDACRTLAARLAQGDSQHLSK